MHFAVWSHLSSRWRNPGSVESFRATETLRRFFIPVQTQLISLESNSLSVEHLLLCPSVDWASPTQGGPKPQFHERANKQ